MSVEILRKRYLAIVKNSLSFLKQEGFQNKGQKYEKQCDGIICQIHPVVEQHHLNNDHHYGFRIEWIISCCDSDLIHAYKILDNAKNIDQAFLMAGFLRLERIERRWYLTDNDPEDFDERFSQEIQREIREFVLPLFSSVHSLDDVIVLAEKDLAANQEERRFFANMNIYEMLKIFYAAKGWKSKLIDIGEQDVKTSHPMLLDYAKETNAKYLEYVEKYKQK